MSRRCARCGPASRSRSKASCTSCAAPRWCSTRARTIRSMSRRPARRCSSLRARSATACCSRPGSRSPSCRQCLDHAEAGVQAKGRDVKKFRRACLINFRVSKDGTSAKAAALRKLAFLFRSRGHADNIKSSNLDIDHQAIMDAHARHDFEGAVKLLPEKAATAFAAAGTPARMPGAPGGISGDRLRRADRRDRGRARGAQARARRAARHFAPLIGLPLVMIA